GEPDPEAPHRGLEARCPPACYPAGLPERLADPRGGGAASCGPARLAGRAAEERALSARCGRAEARDLQGGAGAQRGLGQPGRRADRRAAGRPAAVAAQGAPNLCRDRCREGTGQGPPAAPL
ncbi:MAG: hypothetical protein AVDCRST_MAG61-984, partial [uncultured Friedmanniella sp.]